ncbi:MAG: hypothetical protein ACTHJV_00870, partial [Rhizobiaceae bacterium]
MAKSPMKAVAKASGRAKIKSPAPVASMGASERKWRAEDAMRDIMRAEEHKKDKRLMADVKKLAAEQAAKLNGL